MPKDTDIQSLIDSIDKMDVDSLSFEDRAKLQNASVRWQNKCSSPWDLWFRMGFTQVQILSATKICLDLKLFEAWGKDGGSHKSITELASITEPKCDPALLERLLRLLASAGLVNSVEGNKYGLAPFSKSFQDSASQAAVEFEFDVVLPIFQNLPQFLKSTDYKNPTNFLSTSFTTAFNFNGTYFDFMQQHPGIANNFNLLVKWIHSIEAPWTEIFPTETLLPGKSDAKEGPILVDIGGGLGEAVRLFAQKHGVPRDFLVLQDLKAVLDHAQIDDVARPMEVDFFQPQPVKGASAYLLSHVLHDWPDEMARTILSNIKSAMVPGKSKILLYEVVLHDDPTNTYGPTMDLVMMAALSSRERTLDMWKEIVEPVGLKITKAHFHPTASHAVIEIDVNEHSS